ncbi:glycoside hydrolase family 6 protein [Streptomyces sp. N50]|uniref:glycoside hydrolase family 6 protein n=1 Tax=Streptomyces sp. N50 TaxID=3081765 RepID=UPI0029623FEA|nr:glycoside hydrolase family 6 protein [Streptomyces sp. N50]WOX11467.1 glycoside hydrolase family 6 protein [Streptomyces sp. N50]
MPTYGDLVVNGSFTDGTTGWWSGSTDMVTIAAGTAGLEATASTDAANLWDAVFGQDGITLRPGCRYTLSFTARASQDGTVMAAKVGMDVDPWTAVVEKQLSVPAVDTHFVFSFTSTMATSGQVSFQFGQSSPVTIHLTEVRLTCSTPSEGFYTDPDSNAAKWLLANPDDPRAQKIQRSIARRPAARWFGDWNTDIKADLDAYVAAAAAQGQMPIVALYNMFNRDNGGQSSGGSASPDAYQAWIDAAVAGIGDRPVLVVLEPDLLAQLGNLPSDSACAERTTLAAYAARALATLPETTVYLDGGNPTWIRPPEMAARLKDAGVAQVRGFAVNVANFDSVDVCCTYATQITTELARLGVPGTGFVVDTSRNGNGAMDAEGQHVDWCNPAGRRLGVPSSIGVGGADFLLWIKVPGDSDGSCGVGQGTPAGTFSPYLAERLVDGS